MRGSFVLALFLFLNILLYFSNAHLYFFEAYITSFRPFYWFLITAIVGTGFILLRLKRRLTHQSSYRLIIWASVFIFMATMSFMFISPANDTNLQIYISTLESMGLLVILTILFRDEQAARWATFAVFVVVIFSVLMNYGEFFHIFSSKWHFSSTPGRAAGLYTNSNLAGQQLVMGMVLSVFIVPKKLRWWYCLFVATGVILTFSRAAIILWIIAVLGLGWGNVFTLPRKLSVTVLGVGIVFITVTLSLGSWLGAFESAGLGRYLDSNTRERIGSSFIKQTDSSSKERAAVVKRGFSLAFEKPVIGWGIGATKNPHTGIAPHNMYILMGIEYGIPGLFMLFALMWVLWKADNERSKIMAVLYGVGGVFTHNNLDAMPVIMVLAITVVGIGWQVQQSRYR